MASPHLRYPDSPLPAAATPSPKRIGSCNGEPDSRPGTHTPESNHLKFQRSFKQNTFHKVEYPSGEGNRSLLSPCKGGSREKNMLKMINLDNKHMKEISDDSESYNIFGNQTSESSRPSKGDSSKNSCDDPVSLSKTSSLLRAIHQFDDEEEEDEEDLTDDSSNPSTQKVTNMNQSSCSDMQDLRCGPDEPSAFTVMDNARLVKFERPSNSRGEASAGSASEDNEGFDGHTITLVEDENHAGTFKIAEIGDDNMLRVIDNDRIVVFQDESAVTAVCKEEEDRDGDGVHPPHRSPSFPKSAPLNPALHKHSDANKENNGMHQLASLAAATESYANHQGGAHSIPNFSDPGMMKSVRMDSCSQVSQSQVRANNSAAGLQANASRPLQTRTWHYPNQETNPGGGRSAIMVDPSSVGNAGPHQNSFPEFGAGQTMNSTSVGALNDPSSYPPGFTAQHLKSWVPAAQLSATQSDGSLAEGDHKVPMGGHFGHPSFSTAPPPSYLPAPSAYAGYPGDLNRHWRPTKPQEGSNTEASGGVNGREPGPQLPPLYHPHQSHPRHPQHPPLPFPPPTPIARPYPTYPGWGDGPALPSQRHLRYLPAFRGRSNSRMSKNRGNSSSSSQAPVHINNIPSASTVNAFGMSRSRKRSGSQAELNPPSSTSGKMAFMSTNNSTTFTALPPKMASMEAGRKPVREQVAQAGGPQQAVSISTLGTLTASNVHTLKPGHIIAWYIDYLIHENEDRTQISRAFTLPVNLFHTDDFYFLDSLRKKIRFPSPKFLSWMQCHLPSLNAHAIDFREGRPGQESARSNSASTWTQDWGWQNKSKRDIIHDVFFYFQHRKAASS